MRIDKIVIPIAIQDKLAAKHRVRPDEARYVLASQSRIRFVERGHIPGENVYVAFGQTLAGRFLAVFFIFKPDSHYAIIISARDMTRQERRKYAR